MHRLQKSAFQIQEHPIFFWGGGEIKTVEVFYLLCQRFQMNLGETTYFSTSMLESDYSIMTPLFKLLFPSNLQLILRQLTTSN